MALLLLPTLYFGSLLVVITTTISANENSKKENFISKDDIVEMIFERAIRRDYNPEDSPSNGTSICASVEFLSIPSVQFSRMEIEVEFTFFAAWRDDRLIFDEHIEKYLDKHHAFKLPDVVKKRLWVPQMDFPGCKYCKDTYVTGEEPRPMWLISETRELWLVFRDTMSFYCHYDLTFYPFDIHTCSIFLELDDDDKRLALNDSNSSYFEYRRKRLINSGMPAEFDLDTLFVTHICSLREAGPIDDVDHCTQYGIRFHRIAAYYLMIIYTPSFVIVVISWITFWLPADATAPRVTLGLTSLLTLTAQFATAQKDLPPVAYVKALDVWMLACVVMVFGSLLEFALAHNTHYHHTDGKPLLKRRELKQPAPSFTAKKVKLRAVGRKALAREATTKGKQVSWLDAKARVIFPFIFVLFNLMYWPYYGRGG